MERTTTKAGYVTIIGRPNAGKSTLMNALVGAKISIVTPKPQTTRKRVLGILTENNTQIVFLDTPGVMSPKYAMQSAMMGYVSSSISEADCIVVIYDVTRFNENKPLSEELNSLLEYNNKFSKKPVILLLNKTDLLRERKDVLPLMAYFHATGIFSEIVPISALKEKDVEKDIITTIGKYIPEGKYFYDEDLLSTQPERFFVSEIIRENIFLSYGEEVPYSSEINIIEFKERTHGKWYINAEIIVEKQTQKMIIIGKKGEKLKNVLERSREEIEEHLGTPIFLEVFVKVREKWRDNPSMLRSFGY